MRLSFLAVARGFFGIAALCFGCLWIIQIPNAFATAGVPLTPSTFIELTFKGWCVVVLFPVVLIIGGGFLAFWKNRLFRSAGESNGR